MKKLLSFAAALFVLLSCFAPATAEAGKISVVTTIFPIYDWVREIVGANDHVDVSILLDSGVDLHSYQPTVQDILKVSTADVFAFVGGESDEWLEGALAGAANKDMKVGNLVGAMGEDIKMEEIVEGMEHEHDHDHDHDGHDHDEDDHDHDEDDHDHDEDEDEHDHDHEHEHEHEEEADEHVWLSLRNAQKLVAALTDALCKADPADAEAFRANAAAYIEKLAALDTQYSEAVNSAAFRTILFGDRFPFRYLADDYGLDYFAAFSGCSAESEASFATIVFLAGKVDELGLPTVLTIENPRTRIAQTIVESTQAKNQKILSLDSMQGTTAADIAAGATYLGIMESNLAVLRDALN